MQRAATLFSAQLLAFAAASCWTAVPLFNPSGADFLSASGDVSRPFPVPANTTPLPGSRGVRPGE